MAESWTVLLHGLDRWPDAYSSLLNPVWPAAPVRPCNTTLAVGYRPGFCKAVQFRSGGSDI